MKEINVNIPDGVKKVTIEIQEDGNAVTSYEKPEVKTEEKFELKDGDIIFGYPFPLVKSILIYKGINNTNGILAYAGVLTGLGVKKLYVSENEKYNGYGLMNQYTRPATEEEKQLLFDALAKEGKRWNPETKQFEDLPRWRANRLGTYYYIQCDTNITDSLESGTGFDDACYNASNYFKTREAAERVAEQIREIFKKSKAE